MTEEAQRTEQASTVPEASPQVRLDLTEAQIDLAERQLRMAVETRFRTLVEQIPAVVHISRLDPVSSTIYISPHVETMLGYSPKEWLEDPELWPRIVHPDDLEASLADNKRHIETLTPSTQEYRLIAKDGRVVWIHEEAVVVRDEMGRPQYSQGVMVDITERKQAEDTLRRALEREREALHRLQALDEMKDAFLLAVSHDLRTPLTSILGIAITLARQEVQLSPEEFQDLLGRLATNARKLDRLLSDLLDLDRLSRGIVTPKLEDVDLGALVSSLVEEMDLLNGRPVHVDAEPVAIAVDPAKVERIVENLLANAARHTPPGTPVWVGVTQEDGGALLKVEDAGQGVAPDARDRVFQPFGQATEDVGPSPGIGIGLSLVARFAELHGGRAWVEDRPGGGASFRVFFPQQPRDAVTGTPATAPSPPRPAPR